MSSPPGSGSTTNGRRVGDDIWTVEAEAVVPAALAGAVTPEVADRLACAAQVVAVDRVAEVIEVRGLFP